MVAVVVTVARDGVVARRCTRWPTLGSGRTRSRDDIYKTFAIFAILVPIIFVAVLISAPHDKSMYILNVSI